jgi:Type ISP C-terminal specificity domain
MVKIRGYEPVDITGFMVWRDNPVKGDHTVQAARYSPGQHAIWINKTHLSKPAPQAVWDFHIGGYQVLDKYLSINI